MSTATIAFVRSVIAAPTAAGARAGPSAAPRGPAPPLVRRGTAPRAGPTPLPASRLFDVIGSRRELQPLGPALAAPVDGVEVRLLDLPGDGPGRPDRLVVD